jgi:O-antigen/teichoic acid export membrane protein
MKTVDQYSANADSSLLSPSKVVIKRIWSSQFARDAAILLILNSAARAIGFIGTAYAARCLGPVKLGTSALVQTTAQQVMLSYNGGFDIAALRRIAHDPKSAHRITGTVTAFRLAIAVVAALVWAFVCSFLVAPSHLGVWLLGLPLILTAACSVTFAFQAVEKLPIQNAITTGTALLSAAGYFVFFSPGVFLGADLVVTGSAAVIACLVSWYAFHRTFGAWPLVKARWQEVRDLLREAGPYWALAVVVYFYTVFQIPLVARLIGTREAGIFRAAFLMAAGLELLFNSINSLLLARLIAWNKLGLDAMWRRQFKLCLIYLAIGLPLTGSAFIAAPYVFRFVLGDQFIDGVRIFQILLIGRLIVFVGQIYSWGLAAIGRDRRLLVATTLGALFSVGLNIALIPKYGTIAAACVSVMSEMLVVSYCFLSLRSLVARPSE